MSNTKAQTLRRTIVRCPNCKKSMLLGDVLVEEPRCPVDSAIKTQYYCMYCMYRLSANDLMAYSIEQEKKEWKMNINNLTETEQQDFYRLLKKMEEKEPDKEQDVKVKKPEIGTRYFYLDSVGDIVNAVWDDDEYDNLRWDLGNVFLTEKEIVFAIEKRKVEVELQRYAEEYDDHNYDHHDKRHIVLNTKKRNITTITCWDGKVAGATSFNSNKVANDAIEAVGKDRILKYIFNVES